MKTIILICNYNEEKTGNLRNTLDAVRKNKLENTLVGIIDNASKDKSRQLITEYSDLFDAIIFNKKNYGKAKALNSLLRYFLITSKIDVNEDIIISLDSDIIMCNNFIKISEETFKEYSDCILFTTYGKSFETDTDIIPNMHYFLPDALTKVKDNIGKIQRFQGIAGGIIALRLNHFLAVNGYRQNTGKNKSSAIYGGDDGYLMLDFTLRFKDKYSYFYLGGYHIHPPATDAAYQKWKQEQNILIGTFKGDLADQKGFYD